MDCRSVSLSVMTRRPAKTDQDAVWDMDSGGPKEPCIRWGLDPQLMKGKFLRAKRGRPRTCLIVDTLKTTQQGQHRYGADISWDVIDGRCTLVPAGEYDCVRRRCGFVILVALTTC